MTCGSARTQPQASTFPVLLPVQSPTRHEHCAGIHTDPENGESGTEVKQEELCPGRVMVGASPAPSVWQHKAHTLSNCTPFFWHRVLQPELALSPKSCHDCPGHMCLCRGLHPIPGPGAGSRDVSRPQVPVRTKDLPWAVMVSIDTDVESACPSSG